MTAAGRAPVHVFVACFPAPDMPVAQRPWPVGAVGDDAALQAECRAWGSNAQLFDSATWRLFAPLMRADFRLFHEYNHQHERAALACPVSATWATHDACITEAHVAAWTAVATDCQLASVEGGHLFVYEPAARLQWMERIVAEIDARGYDHA